MTILGTHISSHDITPLDDQLGVAVPRNWPESLDPLITRAPIFAVLDAAQIGDLPERLAATDLSYKCLFTGEAEESWGDQAPWLVALRPDHALLRHLLTDAPDPAPWHLWRKGGVFLQTNAGFDGVWAHLRRFTRVRGPDGNWFMFRFWERHVLPALSRGGDPLAAVMTAPVGRDPLTWLVPDVTANTLQEVTFRGSGHPGAVKVSQRTLALLAEATVVRDRTAELDAALRALGDTLDAQFRGKPDLDTLWARLRDLGMSDAGLRQKAVMLYLQAVTQQEQRAAWDILTRAGPGPQVRVWQLEQMLEGPA